MLSPIASLPFEVRPILAQYLDMLAARDLPVVGVYLYGSLVLGAFHPRSSDIDLVVLTDGSLADAGVQCLRELHEVLARHHVWAERLSIAYVPLADVDRAADAMTYPVTSDGAFQPAGTGDVNAVTWWQLHHDGHPLCGPPPSSLALPVSWAAVVDTMHGNLFGYWPRRAAHPTHFLDDFWVEFAVSTLCRILTTLEDGEIVSKDAAMVRWATRLPPRWGRLLAEAQRLRHQPDAPSRYRSPDERGQDARAFLSYVQERPRCTLAITPDA